MGEFLKNSPSNWGKWGKDDQIGSLNYLDAGQVLEDWAERFTVSEKGPADLVTEADLAAQQAIRNALLAELPDHGFLGEVFRHLRRGAAPHQQGLDARSEMAKQVCKG